MGKLAVATIAYGPGASGPSSVVVKMPTDDPGGVALGQMLRLWEKEARFYLDLAHDLPVRTPQCYWAGGDPATGVYGLVLEDLSHLTNGDQLAGATPDQAAASIDALARWQAAESGDGRSSRLEWMPSTSSDPMYLGLQPMLEAVWPTFVDQLGDQAPAGTLGVLEASIPSLTENFQMRLLEPTLVHSDFRVDNLFFDDDGVIVLDWQAVATGQGLYDLTYFLAGSLSTDRRRADERALVERYRSGLAEGGVAVPPSGEFFALYRRCMLSTAGIAAMLLGQLDFTVNQRAADLARGMASRFLEAAADLDVAEFLSA
jgi:aminoglycoside/choline kinase family phosphotransferase